MWPSAPWDFFHHVWFAILNFPIGGVPSTYFKILLYFHTGGVGLTPMISMLESILESYTNSSKKVIFIQCAKSPSTHSMKNYIDNMSNLARPNLISHVFYSSYFKKSEISLNHTKVHFGRINTKKMEDLLPQPVQDNEFYFCGPPAFMKSIFDTLNSLNVPKDQINYEYFGPTLQWSWNFVIIFIIRPELHYLKDLYF